MFKYIGVSFFITILFYTTVAQTNLPPGTYTSINKKAIRFYEEGKKNYETRKDVEAEKFLNKAIIEDVNFVEAHSALAYLLMEKGKTYDAIIHFQKAIDINPKFFPRNFYDLALAQLIISKYDDATKNLESYLSSDRINPSLKQSAEKFLKNAKFGSQAIKHPAPFKPINLGAGINTSDYEYFPAITADGNTFMFTRNVRSGDGIDAPQQ
jgi:tetratricopeptide (TPR) repeat protein